MSFADYNKQMQLNNAIFSKYQSVLMDTGISSPQGYNVLSDPQVTTLKSAQMAGTAPLYLYTWRAKSSINCEFKFTMFTRLFGKCKTRSQSKEY